jgi:hypothetical protein
VVAEQQEHKGAPTGRGSHNASCCRDQACGKDHLLSKLGLALFKQLKEEYPDPDTLGSIIAAEGAIANVVGMTQ